MSRDLLLELREAANMAMAAGAGVANSLLEVDRILRDNHVPRVMGSSLEQAAKINPHELIQSIAGDRPMLQALMRIMELPGWVSEEQKQDQMAQVIAQGTAAQFERVFSERLPDLFYGLQSELHRHEQDVIRAIVDTAQANQHALKSTEGLKRVGVDIFEAQYPSSKDRLKMLDTYHNDMQWLAANERRRLELEGSMQRVQRDLNNIVRVVPDGPHRHVQIQAMQDSRRTIEDELKFIDNQIMTKFRPSLAIRGERTNARTMEAMDNLGEEHGRKIETIQRKYFAGREHQLYIPIVVARRMFKDRDVATGASWYPKVEDIPPELRQKWKAQNAIWFQDIMDALVQESDRSIVGTPIPTGLDGKQTFKAQTESGSDLIHGLQCKHVKFDALHQEDLTMKFIEAADHLRGGNPARKIELILMPAMQQILALQIPMKAVNTLMPMARVLTKRDERFREICLQDRYAKVGMQENCAPIMAQFLAEISRACEDIERLSSMKPEELWKSNRYVERLITPRERVSAQMAALAEDEWAYEEDDQEYQECVDIPDAIELTCDSDASQEGEDYEALQAETHYVKKRAFGKSRKSWDYHKGKGKGGSRSKGGGKGAPRMWRQSGDLRNQLTTKGHGKVPCDAKGCTMMVSSRADKKWGHLCTRCLGEAHRNGSKYVKKDGQEVQINAQNAFVASAREKALANAIAAKLQAETAPTAVNGFGVSSGQKDVDDDESEEEELYDSRRNPRAERPANKRHRTSNDDDEGMQGILNEQ